MIGKTLLVIGAFVLLISVCGCAQTLEYRLNSVLDEYASAKYPQTEEQSTGETKSFIEQLKKGRQESAKTMEPYAARIEGEVAKTLAEIARKDNKELWRITEEESGKGKPDHEKFHFSDKVMRLPKRIDLSIYTLGRIGPGAVDALASLLKEPWLGQQAAITLGLIGEKEILFKYFENEKSTDAERVNAASSLILFFKEKKLVPFLVDSLLRGGTGKRVSVSDLFCSFALEEFPEETIPPLLKAIEEGRGSEIQLMLSFSFLEKHGVDLQKGIRLHTPGKEGKEVIFIYPTEPLPEEKIKSFLTKLKPEEKEKELLIEVGSTMPYKTFDRVMTLFEQAGIYKIKLGAHKVSLHFETIYLLEPLTLHLAKPVAKPEVPWEALFVEISPVSDEKEKEKGVCFVLKPWQYMYFNLRTEVRKIEHPQFHILEKDLSNLPYGEGIDNFRDFVRETDYFFHPTETFKHLPVVLAPSPELTMQVVLPVAANLHIDDINFLHHTRGCDWERTIVEQAKRVITSLVTLGSHHWLYHHQDTNGKWDMVGFTKNCEKGETCSAGTSIGGYDIAITALALLPFLDSPEVHPDLASFRTDEYYEKTVTRGLEWLLAQQKDDGLFAQEGAEYKLFNHIPAAWAVCRAYKVLGDDKFKIPAQKAVKFLIDSQNLGSGWGKNPKDGNPNTLSTAAAVIALLSAKSAKLDVPESVFKDALKFFDSVTDENGIVGFEKKGDKPPQTKDSKFVDLPSMTAAATACRLLCGVSPDDAAVQKGVKIILQNLPEWDKPDHTKVDFVYWYFGTMAIDKVRGDNWGKWNDALKGAIFEPQRVGGCADGSWDPVDRWSGYLGRVGETALAQITRDIYYSCSQAESQPEEKKEQKEPAKKEK